MSSSAEEDNSDCFSSLFEDDDKLGLLKQTQQQKDQLKRNRQRVDAGEPRNSYSSIPNFSSRSSSLMSGSLYGAIFSQQSQNFGNLFPANYAPAKMLNELLGRQVKQAQDAASATNAASDQLLNQMESAASNLNNNNNNNSVKMEFDINGSAGVNNHQQNSDGNQSPTSANELAHHMLRNILQGKTKDLLALDQELRQVAAAAAVANDRHTPDSNQNTIMNTKVNNHILNNNNIMNNNNNYENVTKSDSLNGSLDSNDPMTSDVTLNKHSGEKENNSSNKSNKMINGNDNSLMETNTNDGKKDEINEIIDDVNSLHDGSNSMPSPSGSVKLKEEMLDGELMETRSPSPSPSASNKSEQGSAMELKRARVENIVSTMHSSPSINPNSAQQQPQVNGCKKRKLYHPQQHDNSAVERYGLSLGLNLHNLMLNDEDEEEEMETNIHQKRVEKSILKSQLRSMQEQLAEMQQKYVQLCNRMEQTSETTEDVDDGNSDLNDEDLMMRDNSSEKRSPSMNSAQQQRTPTASPTMKEMPGKQVQINPAQSMLNQMMSKMISARHPGMPFNGTHPLLQHMQQQQQNAAEHPAFSNAAAMYLSQKLLMEQEVRMAKEAEERNQQMQMQKQQQDQQQKAQQEMMARAEQAQSMHSIPTIKTSPQQMQPQQSQQQVQMNQKPSDLNDRLSMMRANAAMNPNNIGPVTGSDLEGLADVLKSEINASLSTLVDSIVSRFVHQRRVMTKQTEAAAAAAEQLNKDLLMASQILDRKSPRTKSSSNLDRPSGGNSMPSGGSQSGNNGSNISTTNTNNSSSNNNNTNNHLAPPSSSMQQQQVQMQRHLNGNAFPPPAPLGQHHLVPSPMVAPNGHDPPPSNSLNSLTQMQSQMNPLNLPSHVRPSPTANMFQGGVKPPGQGQQGPPGGMNSVAAAALYNSISNSLTGGNPFCMPEPPQRSGNESTNEQNEALSLVVTPKKKRHKVTDTRITPRTVSRILAQDALAAAAAQQSHLEQRQQEQQNQQASQQNQNQNMQGGGQNNMTNQSNMGKQFGGVHTPISTPSSMPSEMPSPRGNFHHSAPPSMLPVSLPTSVAIPNPSLHESQVFSPYSPFFNPHGPHGPQSTPTIHHHMHMSSSPPGMGSMMDPRDSPPLPHPPTMLHPALLAAAHHGSPDAYSHIRAAMENSDRNSECNSADISYDGMQPTISFSNAFLKTLK